MTPFLQLRLWWRRASLAERVPATIALFVVVALAAWVVVPTGGDDSPDATRVVAEGDDQVAAGEGGETEATEVGENPTGPGGTGATGTAGETPGATASGGPSEGPSGATSTATARASCVNPPSGMPGITDKNIQLGMGILALAGPIGNTAVGVGTPDELKRMAQAVVDDINDRGGVQCRQLTLKFYEGNPLNPDEQRATCVQMAQDKSFFIVDAGAFVYPAGAYNCLPQQKVPVVVSGLVLTSEFEKFSPYLVTVGADAGTAMRSTALGLKDLGWFDPAKGFKKLGLLIEDCSPEFVREFESALAKAGITGRQISKYTFTCPSSGFPTPAEMNQAVTQHQLDGVTHVMTLTGGGAFAQYTNFAEGQRFRPKYALNDYNGIILTSTNQPAPNQDNFDRAIAITTQRHGQQTTPGLQPDPGTRRCQAILVKAGFAPDYVYGKQGGGICSLLWTAEAAIKHTRSLTRETVLPGLANAGTVQQAWTFVDNSYKPNKFYGGDTWWQIEFQRECNCWRVPNPNRRPSYAP